MSRWTRRSWATVKAASVAAGVVEGRRHGVEGVAAAAGVVAAAVIRCVASRSQPGVEGAAAAAAGVAGVVDVVAVEDGDDDQRRLINANM